MKRHVQLDGTAEDTATYNGAGKSSSEAKNPCTDIASCSRGVPIVRGSPQTIQTFFKGLGICLKNVANV